MDKLFDSHWALRITALVLAVVLFFYVQSLRTDGKESSASIETDILVDVPLEVYYDKDNLIVTGLPATVDVKIEGPMSVVVQTKRMRDYKVFVDLNSLLIGEHSVTIQTENFSDKLDVKVEPATIKILLEERVTQEFKVEPELNSRLIAEDFVLDSMEANPARVMITGAKSVIDSISYVKATVKSDGSIRESFGLQSNVIVLNRDLNKLDVAIEPLEVEVKVNVKPYTREIPIRLETTGEARDVEVNTVSLSQETIVVTGAKSILDALTEITAQINLEDIEDSGDYEVKFLLPEGVKPLSDKPVTIKADVTIANALNENVIDGDSARNLD
jgi:YbbR domain-containing protein